MSRRFPDIERETNGRPMHRGYCAWIDENTDDVCSYHGQLVRGLCPRHYAQLTSKLAQLGLSRSGALVPEHLPTVCTCATPHPQPCRIIGGTVLVAGALECSSCGRAVL